MEMEVCAAEMEYKCVNYLKYMQLAWNNYKWLKIGPQNLE